MIRKYCEVYIKVNFEIFMFSGYQMSLFYPYISLANKIFWSPTCTSLIHKSLPSRITQSMAVCAISPTLSYL